MRLPEDSVPNKVFIEASGPVDKKKLYFLNAQFLMFFHACATTTNQQFPTTAINKNGLRQYKEKFTQKGERPAVPYSCQLTAITYIKDGERGRRDMIQMMPNEQASYCFPGDYCLAAVFDSSQSNIRRPPKPILHRIRRLRNALISMLIRTFYPHKRER